jgi:hypothetical protein
MTSPVSFGSSLVGTGAFRRSTSDFHIGCLLQKEISKGLFPPPESSSLMYGMYYTIPETYIWLI